MSGYGFSFLITPIADRRVATLRAVSRAIKAGIIEDLSDNAPPMFEDWIHARFLVVGDAADDDDDDDDDERFEVDDDPHPQRVHVGLTSVGYWPDELGDHLLKLAASHFVRIDARLHVLGYRRVGPDHGAAEPLLPTWREAYFGSARSRFASPLFFKLGDGPDDEPSNAHAIMTTAGLATYCAADGEQVHPQTPIALEALSPIERARFDQYIARGYCACAWCLSNGLFSSSNVRGIGSAPAWDVRPLDELHPVLLLDDNVQLCWAVSPSPRRQLRDTVATQFYRSQNGGLDWELLDQADLERAYVLRVAKVRRAGRWVVYAVVSDEPRGAEDRWLCSLDGGITYREEMGSGASCVFDSIELFSCAARRELVAVATAACGGPPSLHVSGDGGASWKTSGFLAAVADVKIVACSPTDPDVLYAVCEAAAASERWLFRSREGGARWELVDTLPTGRVNGVVIGHEPGVVVVLHHDGPASTTRLLRSTDHGRTWSCTLALEDIDETGTAAPSGRGRWFCSTSDAGTYASDDDGATWSLVSAELHGTFLDDDPDDEQGAYVMASGVLVRIRKLASPRPADAG